MAEGVCLVRASDRTIVYANPRFEQIFGYGPGELAGQPVSILNYAEDEAQAAAVVTAITDEAERTGNASFEVHNRKKDGTTFWCRGRTSAFRHPVHGLVWVAVQADVTAEKEAAERLRRHEQLLQTVVDALPVGLWMSDREGRLIRANDAAKRIWAGARYVGIEQYGEYQGWWADTGEPIAAAEWGMARALRRGETSVGELIRIRGFDGTYKTILHAATPLRDGDEITGAIVVNEDVTRLMEAEALSAGVIAAAPDAIVATDGERRITVFNAGAARVFGRDRGETIGRDLGLLVAAEHDDALDAILAAAEAGHGTEPRLLTGCRRSGETFPAEVSAACTRSGPLQRYSLVIRDVTARVHAEEERARLARALEDERTWLHSLVSTAPVGIIAIDAAGQLLYNHRAEELLGVALAGRGPEAYVGVVRRADRAPLSLAELPSSRALRGETVVSEEQLFVRPDGSQRWILASAAPARYAGGHRIGAISIFADISAQKRLESEQRFLAEAGTALAQSLGYEATLQQVARLAVPCLADGCVIYIVDENGEVTPAAIHCDDLDVMRATEEALRRYPVRGAARGAGRVVRTGQPELVAELPEAVRQQFARDPAHAELLARTRARSYLTVPLRAREEIIGALTLFDTDAGRSLGPHDVELGEILGQRAGLAIDNARLYRAARRATQARDEVLAVVAHDLRGPLNTIGLVSDAIARSGPPGTASTHRHVGSIRRAVKQIDRLIADLLDAAQLEAGTLRLEPATLDPAEVVAEAVEAMRTSAGEHTLEVDVPAGLPAVRADRDRILQVLGNLLGNAVKFTPPGGRIVVSAARRERDVLLRVCDSGPGLSADQIGHVFDRFWQAVPSDRRGAGLGLAITRGLVEAHGGTIWVESQPGAGATFCFTLPVVA
jgi:PAS domain S-box-containing protein